MTKFLCEAAGLQPRYVRRALPAGLQPHYGRRALPAGSSGGLAAAIWTTGSSGRLARAHVASSSALRRLFGDAGENSRALNQNFFRCSKRAQTFPGATSYARASVLGFLSCTSQACRLRPIPRKYSSPSHSPRDEAADSTPPQDGS